MKFLSYGVMIYMLLALIWWTVLLSKNNNELFKSKLEILEIGTKNAPDTTNDQKLNNNDLYLEYNKKKYMIIGEGMVFGISLIIGMWLIQKAYTRELENTQKQKNFLLSITHELKTPITSIGLISDTLQQRKLSDDLRVSMVESIISENKRLESLVSNLLITTRLDNNYAFNFEPINLEELLINIKKTITLTHPEVHINIKTSENFPQVSCDKEAMLSVFINLIENCIKYSETPAIIEISIKQQDQNAVISFSDFGPGIPDREKSKVFGQFYRSGNEETRKTKGTGLGLYIVKKIIDGHHGTVTISDNTPNGTIFSIKLPINQYS